jgi:hypothetical protein
MWFTENAWPPMIIAAVVALIFLGMWNSNRRNLHLILAVACLLLCVGFYFLERMIVTDGERLQAIVVNLCQDFREKKATVIDYVSNAHPEIKLKFAGALALVSVHDDMRLSDFQTEMTKDGTEGTVHFRANASLTVAGFGDVGYQPARIVLKFHREKGEWKIIEVRRLNPINGKEMDVLDQSAG